MRVNLPVSDEEYVVPGGATLVSVTDAKGRILYCNQAFIEVSGYTSSELLGQPHNIIRHPDVPEEAFRDLWETIQEGQPWSAVLKNRRKDGSHYWVVANVTPLFDGGASSGYMSVRTEATREQIESTERLFAAMRMEKEEGRLTTVFRNGRPVRSTWMGSIAEKLRPDLSARLLLLLSLLSFVSSSLMWWSQNLSVPLPWHVLACAVATALTWCGMKRLFISPLNALIHAANRIAACDLSQVVTRDRKDRYGELQAALGQVVVNLQSIVRDARNQNMQLVSNISGISKGSVDLAQRTEGQGASLQQTAAALEQVTTVAQATADSARDAADSSTEAVSVTESSAASVEELGRTMDSIRDASDHIRDIIEVIDSIAFQTNILALNAAVEAARAGESGRGFAVVASEVRALSQRTSTAAAEVSKIIANASAYISQGHAKSEEALASMQNAVASIRSVHDRVNGIDRAITEQLDGISQINIAVGNLDLATRANVEFAESMAHATLELKQLSEAAAETVRVFRVDSRPVETQDAVSLRRAAKLAELPGLTAP